MQFAAALIFLLALIHTFSTKYFEHLAHQLPRYRHILHLFGEVELVFGLWSIVLLLVMSYWQGASVALNYLETRHYTEPAFVFVIMVVAASRPVIFFVQRSLHMLSRRTGAQARLTEIWLSLALVPLLGSLITEPAAMTIAAMMLLRSVFMQRIPETYKYATLAVLLVNISIGGVLTSYAAPPVLMVANVWQWDSMYMFLHFGDRAALAVLINASLLTWLLRKQSILMQSAPESMDMRPVPLAISLVHIAFLVGIVMFSHHASVFIALFLIFLGFTQAFAGYQNRLILREAMLVALFLAGLVILGGQQQWWLQPIVESLQPKQLFFSTAALTAVTDNAALTYLGSLISNISQEAKYALLAGAVAGGGLTVIANAPNPAGVALLRKGFTDEAISALQLLLVALIPTAVAVVCFLL